MYLFWVGRLFLRATLGQANLRSHHLESPRARFLNMARHQAGLVPKLFGFLYSPPSRACFTYLKHHNVDFEFVEINAWKDENETPEFRKMNPFGTIPFFRDETTSLAQSHTILRYVSNAYAERSWLGVGNGVDHAGEAIVNESLDWQLLRLRPAIATLLRFDRIRGSSLVDPPNVSLQALVGKSDGIEPEAALQAALGIFEGSLEKQSFITGEEPSIADLTAACEIEQIALEHENMLNKFEKLKEWLSYFRKLDAFKEAHKGLGKTHEDIVGSSERGSFVRALRAGAIDS